MVNRKLNAILESTRDRVAFYNHAVPSLPETKPRDAEQRSRVIAVEMRMIEERLDWSKFSKPDPELVATWKKFM